MSQTQDILFDVTGQSLYFDCPEGRPSSVTSVTAYENSQGDDGTTESATTGSASVEANPSTTFDAASGVSQSDPTVCNLTATTGISIGRTYLAENALGETEWVEVTGVSDGAYVLARDPLANDYAAADTFVSTRISISVDSTWVADTSNISAEFDPNPKYRVRWVYVVGGITHVADTYFDLVRYAARHSVKPGDVDRRSPGWLDKLPSYYREDQGRSLIDTAYEQVKFDLYQELKPDQTIRNREALDEVVAWRAVWLVTQTEADMKMYRDRFAQLLHWTKVPMDQDGSGAGTAASPLPLWRR